MEKIQRKSSLLPSLKEAGKFEILYYNSLIYVFVYFQTTDDNANTRVSSRSGRADEPHIGKYRLIKTIGKGNFAKVKLAKHVPTGREVCIINSITLSILCYQ